jgi:ABC-type phosphate transport system substrate-binding protein
MAGEQRWQPEVLPNENAIYEENWSESFWEMKMKRNIRDQFEQIKYFVFFQFYKDPSGQKKSSKIAQFFTQFLFDQKMSAW